MISRKGTFYLGIFVFLIPFLGFPTMWKMVLVVIAGLSMIIYSIKMPLPRKNFKQKVKKEISPIENVNTVEDSIEKEVEIPVVRPTPEIIPEPVKTPPIIKIEPAVKKTRKPRSTTSTKKIIVKE